MTEEEILINEWESQCLLRVREWPCFLRGKRKRLCADATEAEKERCKNANAALRQSHSTVHMPPGRLFPPRKLHQSIIQFYHNTYHHGSRRSYASVRIHLNTPSIGSSQDFFRVLRYPAEGLRRSVKELCAMRTT